MNISNLENPIRLAELDPEKTLNRIGLCRNDVLCDIGAGSGVFSIPAAKISRNQVFALDIDDNFLRIIDNKAKQENLTNIRTMRVTGSQFDVRSDSIDVVILVTVFHEISNKFELINEIERISKKTGKLAIIEFLKRKTSIGPPPHGRLGKQDVESLLRLSSFSKIDEFDLGENFYCLVFSF